MLLFHDPATLDVTARVPLTEHSTNGCDARVLALSSDRTRAYVGGSSFLASVDLATKAVHTHVKLAAEDTPSAPFAFLHDGTFLRDGQAGIDIVDPEKLTTSRSFTWSEQTSWVSASFSMRRGTDTIVTFLNGTLSVVEPRTGQVVASTKTPGDVVRRHDRVRERQRGVLVSFREEANAGIAAFDPSTLKKIGELDHLHADSQGIRFLCESPDGTRILEGGDDETALLIDASAFAGGGK